VMHCLCLIAWRWGGVSVPHPRARAKYRKYILNTPLQIVHLRIAGSLVSKEVSIEVHVVEVEVRIMCDFFAFVKHTTVQFRVVK